MTPGRWKIKHRISKETDLEKLRKYALLLLETIDLKSEHPANYDVVAWAGRGPANLHSGTKESCQGYAEAIESDWDTVVVVCGQFVVWPEGRWGSTLEDLRKLELANLGHGVE
jgi:hypothetical protein